MAEKNKDSLKQIENTIRYFDGKKLYESSIAFYKALGYESDKTDRISPNTFGGFLSSFNIKAESFNNEKAMATNWEKVEFVFQLSTDELSGQSELFDNKKIDNKRIESYLFFSIELKNREYTRTQLVKITREINKLFPMPVLLLFKYGSRLTLSVINRRLNKRDEQKDVLEKVTLLKDISIEAPHRAHLEILFDLSLNGLSRNYKISNFVDLHNAWEKTLDTKELNKRFYRDLSNWYFWALQEVHFPASDWAADKTGLLSESDKVKEHNAKNLIRLLTRLLFVWFVKEKNLIPDELFDEDYIGENLIEGFEPRKKKGFDHNTQGSKYYRAILQNLFFATLNQPVGKREFRKEGQNMNTTNLMRYESYFKNPKAFIELVENVVPFMNGGLFECLDAPDPKLKGKRGGDIIIYEDGFSDRKDNSLCVPDYIFFGTSEHADLSNELGDKKLKDVSVEGLINVLKHYKFTVTENTPIEEDVALDPELLGHVFENLLASYNPETKTTARKQTGSFYTPREIVNYMVDESLKAYLKQKLEAEAAMKGEDAETGLELLLGYNEREHLFDDRHVSILINAIDNCKILDPACGSGAFPMGILHKMVHILYKLDPLNQRWKDRQIEKAMVIEDSSIRENLISDIETAFENNELDYGRKLYLIENCIYGVDIQPIATQISKLRFFISLIVDQKSDKKRDNFGIRPLPNLETKFVAANTLIPLDKPDGFLRNIELDNIEDKLKEVRHRLFSAKTPATKRKLRDEDQRLREQMKSVLIKAGWNNESAQQLVEWDPYNQNVSSDWFDSEWMFGIPNEFCIILGNPPYISAVSMARNQSEKECYKKNYPEATGSYDIYILFLLKTVNLLNRTGVYSWIIPNKFLVADYAKNTKNRLMQNGLKYSVDVSIFNVFELASVYPIIIIGHKDYHKKYQEYFVDDYKDLENKKFRVPLKLAVHSTFKDHNIKFASGATGFEAQKLSKLLTTIKTSDSIPFVVSGSLDRYKVLNKNVRYMGVVYERAYIKHSNEISSSKWEMWSRPKIVIAGMTKVLEAVWVEEPLALGVGVYAIYRWDGFSPKYLLAVLNSKYLSYYINHKFKDKHLAGGYLAINKSTLEQMPLVVPPQNITESIEKLVDKINHRKSIDFKSDTIMYEKQIDEIIYKLYQLSESDIIVVENNYKEKYETLHSR